MSFIRKSRRMKRKFENSESSVCERGTSKIFWGIMLESGKRYGQVVGKRFRITMAVLDPLSLRNDESHVSLTVIQNEIEFLLCVLKHGEIQQVNLNLEFDQGDNVIFFVKGRGKVYLSGYQLSNSEGDVSNDENGYLCPLVEVKQQPKSKKKAKSNASNLSHDMSEGGSNTERSLWQSFINEVNTDDEDDDDDEDFSVADESVSESDEDSLSESVDEVYMLENDAEEKVTSDDIEELSENSSDEEVEINQNYVLRKRKKQGEFLPPKRSRNSGASVKSSSSFWENSEDVIEVGETESNNKNAGFQRNSATSSTPVPSEKNNSGKKTKKKKRLSEISSLNEIPSTSKMSNKNSPNGAKESRVIYPVNKLENGVHTQDVIVGKGPEAKKGKLVHVFYIGRFPDKSIFDSQVSPKKPLSFKLGENEVIKGFDIGIEGMKVGGKRKIKIPPTMGYGRAGNDNIPPNTTLYFSVELISVS